MELTILKGKGTAGSSLWRITTNAYPPPSNMEPKAGSGIVSCERFGGEASRIQPQRFTELHHMTYDLAVINLHGYRRLRSVPVCLIAKVFPTHNRLSDVCTPDRVTWNCIANDSLQAAWNSGVLFFLDFSMMSWTLIPHEKRRHAKLS